MIRYPAVTHVIFDLDGTLIDSDDIINNIFANIVRKKYYKDYSPHIRHKTAGHSRINAVNIIIKECKLPCTTLEFMEEVNRISRLSYVDCQLKPGVERLITHLYNNNIPMCVATSSNWESVMFKISKHKNLFTMLSHITCAANNPQVRHAKPAPDVFLVAASEFCNKRSIPRPYNCLVFEDSRVGVLAARRAGMQVVMIPDPTLPEDDTYMATLVLNSMEYFQPELFGLPPFEMS